MKPEFITVADFADIPRRNVFHKEHAPELPPETDPKYLNRHILFRKRAALGEFKSATLRITADDYYKLYINGSFVTSGPAPAYPHCYYYNELDVTDLIRKGENLFAVHTYYQGLINRVWVSSDRRHMLWLELLLDGESVLVSDEGWLTAPHSAYSEMGRVGYDTAFLERYDSRAPECNFFSLDFDESSWTHATLVKSPDYTLTRQPTRQLDIYHIRPTSLTREGNRITIDLGREVVGYPTPTVKGERSSTVLIKCGEETEPDGTIRFDMRCNCRYLEEWILSGGVDTLAQFDYKAFRYVELELPEGAELIDFTVLVRHYPFSDNGKYSIDSPKLRKILDLCRDTIKYGTQEIYMDCPSREKGQYLGDLSVSGRAHVLLTGDTSLFRKAIDNFLDSTFICPGVMAVSVCSLMQEIADYSLELPSQIAWLYSIEGDISLLWRAEPYIRRMVEYFERFENSEGLLETVSEKWNLVDWPENLRDGYSFPLTRPQIHPGVHNVINARYVAFLESVDEIFSLLGMPSLGKLERTRRAFFDTFYSPKLGLFADDTTHTHASVHSNIFPLLLGIGAEDTALTERLVAFIRKKGLESMGVYMAYYALAALIRNGRMDIALELATSEGAWMNMLREGATTTYEAWGKEQKWNTSLFHPWATAPLIVFADGARIY